MTRAERALLAAQANREDEEAKRLGRLRQKAEDKAAGIGEGGKYASKVHPEATISCPDPSSPDAMRSLFAIAYRRMWNMLHAPLTDQDMIGAFSATRLAASIGKHGQNR